MASADRVGTKDWAAFSLAFFLSAFGYEVLFFTMTLRVYDISRSAINVGIFAAITFLPKLLSPAYGTVVDRYGSRRTVLATASVTAFLALCLPLVAALGPLYALWFLLSVLFMILANARTVLMTQVARTGGYVGGNALALTFLNAARLGAPLLAGILSISMGTRGLTMISAGVFGLCAASAASLTKLLFPAPPRAARDPRAARTGRMAALASLGEGFARIRGSRDLRFLVGVSSIRNFFLGFLPSLLIILVTGGLGRSSADYGFALTAAALGSLGGSLAGPLIAKAAPRRVAAALGLGLHFASVASLGLVGSYAAAVAALVAGSFALHAAAVVLHSRRDSATALESRGRVYGANTTIQTIPSLLSMVAGGALADRFGAGPVFVAGGAAALAALAAVSIGVAARDRRRRA